MKIDYPNCLNDYHALWTEEGERLDFGAPISKETFIERWYAGRVISSSLENDLLCHMHQAYPRSWIGGWLRQAQYRVRQWNARRSKVPVQVSYW